MSRDEMTADARAQLDALDRILAQERVGEEHLELAALVDSVRAGAPQMRPEFRERLDGAVRARLRGAPARRRARPRLRVLAIGGGGLVTAAVAFAIVLSSGVLNGATHIPPLGPANGRALGPAALGTRAATHSSATPPSFAAAGPTAATGSAAAPRATARLVHKGSQLVLGATPGRIGHVANVIVAQTERHGGVVASSSVSVAGRGGEARFRLQVPSGHLGGLIGALSSVASVQSLTQATHDVTSTYDAIAARLADHRAQASSLRTQLASAPTVAQEDALQKQLHALERRIAAEAGAVASLLGAAQTATLAVTVVGIVPPPHHHHSGAAGPLATSFHDALHVLVEMLAVALVVLAIALPVALTGLAVGWSASALRQRSRERAIRAA